ncbi:MAG: putative PEP-binding protein, partial [Candidatus Thermoplasmatota archaeon]|nr:putative PEP-binding protein [Candidatus Thermoplasmatota archaeon]
DGLEVTVHADQGTVLEGIEDLPEKEAASTTPSAAVVSKPVTATEVKVNISMPEATERARATDADGVGLLRIEHIVLGLGEHPLNLLNGDREEEYIEYLVDNIRTVASAFAGRPVWVRTLDAPTDEFRQMPGGDREPHEANPMLGWRGIRRGLEQQVLLEAEFEALRRLREEGYTNVGVMLPLVQHPKEVREAKAIARQVGLDPDDPGFQFGIMIEIPAAALIIDEFLEEGLDFVSFGTNDLTQYTLAVDRNNENVAPLFTEFHPAIAKLVQMVIEACNRHGVQSSICGQAGSDPAFVKKLIQWGITSVSANIDAVANVRETVARVEKKLLLDAARQG